MAAGSVFIEQKRKRFSCSLPDSESHILENPVQLLCRHHFCRECLNSDKFEQKYDKQETGAEQQQQGNNEKKLLRLTCPVCKTVSENKDIVEDPAITQIVAVFKKTISGDQKCDICNSKMSDVRCYDCNQDLCKDCSFQHSIISASKMHEPKSLQEVEQRIIVSSTHFCEPHKKTKELYCMVCEVVKCYLCDLLKSCGHKDAQKVMTIPEAVELLKKSGDKTIQQIGGDIDFLKDRLSKLDTLQRESEMEENNKVNDIDEKTNALINRLKNDAEQVKAEMKGFYSEKKQEIEADRCITSATLEKVLALMEYLHTILDHIEGADLLLQLQSKFRQLLNDYQPYDRSIQPVMKVKKQVQHKEYVDNIVAIVKNEGEIIPQIHEKLKTVETNLAESCKKSQQLQSENGEKKKKMQELETSVKELQEQNKKQTDDIKATNEKHNAAEAKIKELETSNNKNATENKKLQDEVKAATDKHNNVEVKLKETQEAQKKTAADNEAAKKKLQDEVAAKEAKIKELEKQVQDKTNEAKAASDKHKAAETKIKDTEAANKKNIDAKDAKIKQLEAEIAKLKPAPAPAKK